MSFSVTQILLFCLAYLSGLFGIAYLAERGFIPERITRHPAVYVLSLGVFGGAMASNGAISLALQYGYNFLLYYGGTVIVFSLAPLLLMPLLRLCRVYQLASLADLLTFRFRSPWVGAAITIAMCITVLPLIALQIQAVADTIHILANGVSAVEASNGLHRKLAMFFCLMITAFAFLFGTRHASSQRRNSGLVTAIAFESLVKLGAMLILMFAAIYGVFGGFSALETWLVDNPRYLAAVNQSMLEGSTRAMLVVFFAGAVCMPHMFHMTFTENSDSRHLRVATWGLPLYMLLLSLPILPIAWGGIVLGHSLDTPYSGLAIGSSLNSPLLSATAFVAGLSAASATIIVTTLALANMCLNHLVLPLRPLRITTGQAIYGQLIWLRRSLIAILILAGYLLFTILGGAVGLTELALVAFSGVLQFFPGVMATCYWPKANRKGLLTGLLCGLGLWYLSLLSPLTGAAEPEWLGELYLWLFGEERDAWSSVSLFSLGMNLVLFLVVSLFTGRSQEEAIAAQICSMDSIGKAPRRTLSAQNAAEFVTRLAPVLGEQTALNECNRALQELQFNLTESRPYALRRLRARLEANLSGLLGPGEAHRMIESCIPFVHNTGPESEDQFLLERNVDRAQPYLTGVSANIDRLRRHHRETLDTLPIGICSIGADDEILMWNRSMVNITGIESAQVLGSRVDSIPQPWAKILHDFSVSESETNAKREISEQRDTPQWLSLHKTQTTQSSQALQTHPGTMATQGDTIVLVEDITELELLETELLHSERLASIGRLAAGVAHEIGNPITGIACLAQNLEYEDDPQEVRIAAQDILKQTSRVTRIVESLMNFSHNGTTETEVIMRPANLADCVDEAIHLLSLDRDANAVTYDNRCDREVLVLADNQRLLQVFVNLLGNARDACDNEGRVSISARYSDDTVAIQVEDNGAGIPQEIQNKVFEPFYTTKDPGAGTGLGLALVYNIMDDMDGKVSITSPIRTADSAGGPGTRFTLELKRAEYDSSLDL